MPSSNYWLLPLPPKAEGFSTNMTKRTQCSDKTERLDREDYPRIAEGSSTNVTKYTMQ